MKLRATNTTRSGRLYAYVSRAPVKGAATRIVVLTGVLIIGVTSALGADIKLAGVFDPYEAQDKSVTNAVVMKAQPKCGECHAWGVIKGNTLELKVAHGKKTNTWSVAGEPKGGQIIFEKPKFQMTYSDGQLKGEYKGKMNAHVSLKAEK